MNAARFLYAVVVFWVGSEIGILLVKRSKAGQATRQDRLSIHVLWICCMLGPMLGGILTGVRRAQMPATIRPYAYFGGVALIVIGIAVRWTAIATLKRYFTVDVAIAKDHKVIDSGLYGIVRHPSYYSRIASASATASMPRTRRRRRSRPPSPRDSTRSRTRFAPSFAVHRTRSQTAATGSFAVWLRTR